MTIVLVILTTILCICNIGLLCVGSYHLGAKSAKKNVTSASQAEQPAPEPTEEERIELDRQKRRTESELEALQNLMNYNADVAYGIKREVTDE